MALILILTCRRFTFHLKVNACLGPAALVLIAQAIFLLERGQTDRQTNTHRSN